jgi:signal transduction histidine kinase
VLKHASPARTAVHVEYRPRELLIKVSDDGRPTGPRAACGEPPGPGGRGLIGLRERIALYHGEFDAGPRPGGGWRISARIPLEPVADGQAAISAGFQAATSRPRRATPSGHPVWSSPTTSSWYAAGSG